MGVNTGLALLLAALTCFSAGAATAAPRDLVGYKCTQPGARGQDWIQPLIFVAYDRAAARVFVSDPMILHVNDGLPVTGTVAVENAKRITFTWEVPVVLQVTPVIMRYRGTYVKSTGVFSVVATPEGYSNNFTRGGTCVVERLTD